MNEALWAILPIVYALYIVAHTAGIRRLGRHIPPSLPICRVQVVIPFRNEAPALAQHLPIVQRALPGTAHLTLVDDHSEDDSRNLAQRLLHPRFQLLPAWGLGKKAALATGIDALQTDWIVTTDADCHPLSTDWLRGLLAAHPENPEVVCCIGPIRKTHNGSLFQQLQALESAGLVALAAGAVGLGTPTLANGANLAFRRSAFRAVAGYRGIDHIASGDDELLVHKFVRRFGPRAIRFAFAATAIVETPAESSLAALLRQRLRWVSKSRAYTHPAIRWGQWLAYGAYLSLLVLTLRAVVYPVAADWAWVAWGAKLAAEFSLLLPATALLGQRRLLLWLPVYQLPYLVYVLYIGMAGYFVKSYTWKGRRVR